MKLKYYTAIDIAITIINHRIIGKLSIAAHSEKVNDAPTPI
jgi:hypothetical protein